MFILILTSHLNFPECKEKLSFEEQPENKFLSTTSNIDYNEPNALPQQAKSVISTKTMVKKPKGYKKGSPEKNLPPKGCLDGPRLCRSLPRLSTGCTTVQGCSESAIAFSQRQMHDIESLASKLMSELNSMKVIVEEKLLFEAYRSPSLKNEADEVLIKVFKTCRVHYERGNYVFSFTPFLFMYLTILMILFGR